MQQVAQLKLISLNLANSAYDEKTPLRFGLRFEAIVNFLAEQHADIICLQEVRKCTNAKGESWSPLEIMIAFATRLGMEFKYTSNNVTELSFYRCTLFKPTKLFPIAEKTVWTGSSATEPSGTQWCQSILMTHFILIETATFENAEYKAGTQLRVWNCHAPIGLEGLRYGEVLTSAVGPATSVVDIIVGDFNSIPDLGGPQQMAYLEDKFVNPSKHIPQTFYSFPHDLSKTGERFSSKLDQVFVHNEHQDKIAAVETIDWRNNQLSDHWPLVAIVKLS